MHLWQIRQFPNEPQNLLAGNILRSLPVLCVILSLTSILPAQSDGPDAGAGANGDAELSAQSYFDKALKSLNAHQTIQAKLVEQVTISDQPIRLTGRYVGQANKIRLELAVKLTGDAKGSLLEVSDGENLWSQTVIADTRQVTLRNLKQIATVLASQATETSPSWEVELGLGGVSGLMSSLHRNMDFEQLREETRGEDRFVIVQGKWKPKFTEKWQRTKDQPLPSYVPDLLRIYFHADTQFPQRFLYLKKSEEKSTYRPLVRLEFQDVRLDAPVDASEFEFTPPEDLVPEDVTQRYIDQITRASGPPAEAAKPPASAGPAK